MTELDGSDLLPPAGDLVGRWWQDFLEKDDRTSPEDYTVARAIYLAHRIRRALLEDGGADAQPR